MDLRQFELQVKEFVLEIKELLDTCSPGEADLSRARAASEEFRATFKASKFLRFGKDRSERASISCGFNFCTNLTAKHLAVKSSSFKVEFRAKKWPVPIVRFEYDRNTRNKPVQYFQFHSESLPLAILLARSGRYDVAAQQEDIHFPMGGHRFKACLEDVIELAIREFGVASNPGWEDRVNKGRLAYHDRQTDTIIPKNQERSMEILKGLGFKVECPKGFKFLEKYISDEWQFQIL